MQHSHLNPHQSRYVCASIWSAFASGTNVIKCCFSLGLPAVVTIMLTLLGLNSYDEICAWPKEPCGRREFWTTPFLYSHSLDIPTSRHFCSRQYWQRFRWSLLMAHSPEPLHVYTRFFLILRLKKPLQPSQLTAP